MSDGGAQAQRLFLGSTYPGFTIDFTTAGTSSGKNIWLDEGKTTSVQQIQADSKGMASWYADGDYRMVVKDSDGIVLWTWDNVKMTSDTATMWEGNVGTAYPSATSMNQWQMFALVTASDKLVFVGINDGTAFINVFQPFGVGADVASATALPVINDGDYFDVTGTTTITSIASLGVGRRITLQFDGVVTITHSATDLILPSGNNIVTKAGDVFTFTEYASGDWRLLSANRPIDSKGANIASATALPVLAPGTFDVTGVTTITSINSIGIGSVIHLQFDGALTFTHHATNLILPGGFDITTQAGDICTLMEYASGDWMLLSMNRGKAGSVVQAVNTQTGAVNTGTTVFPYDDTIPQNTEGDEYMTLTITPVNTNNKLLIEVVLVGASSNADSHLSVGLFQDTTANALAASVGPRNGAANTITCVKFQHEMSAGTTSATTFKVRAGTLSAGTTTFNGSSAGRIFGGVMASSIRITEVQV